MTAQRKKVIVRDVMKNEYDIVDGMISVKDAMLAMKFRNNKSLIVDKRDEHDEYGMVLISDIATKVLAVDRSPERVNIYEVMTKPILTIDPEMDIRYAARLFDRFGLSRTPVVENGKVIGIVSYTDMVLKGLVEILRRTMTKDWRCRYMDVDRILMNVRKLKKRYLKTQKQDNGR
jgi:signal-transduction protein with cAMP-binding, CBS, and nucleotidyltransferase domain